MTTKEKIAILSEQITPTRHAKMLYALEYRTRKIALVLEDIYQSHNAAAAFRSCDAFGLQNAFVIENRYPMRISHNVDMGASKWMDVKKFRSPTCTSAEHAKNREPNEFDLQNTKHAMSEIKGAGYTIAAATLREDSINLCDIPVDKPIAIMIGTELTGLSESAHKHADIAFKMDMLGFAQSFNLSVFSALCISELSRRIRAKDDSWKMGEDEKDDLLLHWLSMSTS